MAQTNEPKLCEECGFSVDSMEHKRGVGLHGAARVLPEPEPEPEPVATPTIMRELTLEEQLLASKARLEEYQAGPLPCTENDEAIAAIDGALGWLAYRAKLREEQGVAGTPNPHGYVEPESEPTEENTAVKERDAAYERIAQLEKDNAALQALLAKPVQKAAKTKAQE